MLAKLIALSHTFLREAELWFLESAQNTEFLSLMFKSAKHLMWARIEMVYSDRREIKAVF